MTDPMEAAQDHGRAAKQFAEAFAAVEDARQALFSLARLEETTFPADNVYESAVARYQVASDDFCRAQEALNEAQSADPRPLCVACYRRLFVGEETQTCSATGYMRKHHVREAT